MGGHMRSMIDDLYGWFAEAAVSRPRNMKCKFLQNKMNFLGQIVDQFGVRPDPHKIIAILHFWMPSSVENISCLLGMANQLSKLSTH